MTFADAVKAAQAVCSVEGVVVCDDIAAKDAITLAGTLIADVLAIYQRWIHVYLSVQGVQTTESWADYLARVTAYQDGIADGGVTLIPRLFGAEPGVYVGRLHQNTGAPTNGGSFTTAATAATTTKNKYKGLIA